MICPCGQKLIRTGEVWACARCHFAVTLASVLRLPWCLTCEIPCWPVALAGARTTFKCPGCGAAKLRQVDPAS